MLSKPFTFGFTASVTLLGAINYITVDAPYGHDGNSHSSTYSGFPFPMYEHAYLEPAYIWSGAIANLLVAITLSLALGWIAKKIASRRSRFY